MWFLAVPVSLIVGVWVGRRLRTSSPRPKTHSLGASGDGADPSAELSAGDGAEALARIAHEFKSPLGALSCSLETQERVLVRAIGSEETPETLAATRALRTARTALAQIVDLTERLRSGRSRSQVAVPVPAQDLVETAVLLTAHELVGITIEREDAEPILVEAVPGDVVGILANLLVNAARATRGSGRIRIATRSGNGFAEFLVSDDGPGIDPGAGEQIFGAEYSRWPNGVQGEGYGLAIARERARASGGDLLVLPMMPPSRVENDPPSSAARGSSTGGAGGTLSGASRPGDTLSGASRPGDTRPGASLPGASFLLRLPIPRKEGA